MNILLFGSGNVATYLMQQWSLYKSHCVYLATSQQPFIQYWTQQYAQCYAYQSRNTTIDFDVIILAVKDDVIEEKLQWINPSTQALVVHTSGAMDLNVLSAFKKHGVFYPLQSFSKQNQLTYTQFPFLIEAYHTNDERLLKNILPHHSHYIYCNSEVRRTHHLAAVITANFANHLLCLVEESFKDSTFQIQSLKNLLFETLHKSFESGPCINQTGPAVRADYKTIAVHQQLLNQHPDVLNIYNLLTTSIIKKHNNESI